MQDVHYFDKDAVADVKQKVVSHVDGLGQIIYFVGLLFSIDGFGYFGFLHTSKN